MTDEAVALVVRIRSLAVPRRAGLSGAELGPDTAAELARLMAEHPLRSRGPAAGASIVLPGATVRVPRGADAATVARAIAAYLHSELGQPMGLR